MSRMRTRTRGYAGTMCDSRLAGLGLGTTLEQRFPQIRSPSCPSSVSPCDCFRLPIHWRSRPEPISHESVKCSYAQRVVKFSPTCIGISHISFRSSWWCPSDRRRSDLQSTRLPDPGRQRRLIGGLSTSPPVSAAPPAAHRSAHCRMRPASCRSFNLSVSSCFSSGIWCRRRPAAAWRQYPELLGASGA